MIEVKLNNVRFSYLNAVKPRTQMNDDGEAVAKYQGTFIFDVDSDAHKTAIKAIEDAAKEKWGEKATGVLKQLYTQNRVCLKEGNTEMDRDGEIRPGFEGKMSVRASAPTVDKDGQEMPAPRVYNRFGTKVTPENRGHLTGELRGPQSGDYGQALIQIWAQDNSDPKIGRRINATLIGVALSKFGEPLGRREKTDEEVASQFDFAEPSGVMED